MSVRKLTKCQTTMTPRLPDWYCKGCATYPGNLGPCRTFEKGRNGRCVYCDHSIICHTKRPAPGDGENK